MKSNRIVSMVLVASLLTLTACGREESSSANAKSISEAIASIEDGNVALSGALPSKQEEQVGLAQGRFSAGCVSNVSKKNSENPSESVTACAGTTAAATDCGNAVPTSDEKVVPYSQNWPHISSYVGDGNGPGMKIRDDFDYSYYLPSNGSWDRVYAVTASNGIQIKTLSYYAHSEGVGDFIEYDPIPDGNGRDMEPNTPYMIAFNEIKAEYLGIPVQNNTASEAATLPYTSTMRTSFDVEDPTLLAFKEAVDRKRAEADSREYIDRSEYKDFINDQLDLFYDGICEIDRTGKILWWFRYLDDHWELWLWVNPVEYQWAAIKNILHYISPDGDSIYDAIYDDFYVASYENPIEDWGSYWPIGNSYVMADPDCIGTDHATWYFK